jgi:hypothetical protein
VLKALILLDKAQINFNKSKKNMTEIILNANLFDVNLSHETIINHINFANVPQANTSGFRICCEL